VKKIRETVGDRPVYLSIDIDSIDPASVLVPPFGVLLTERRRFAPATGTPEIIRGLDGLHIVSADIVEVAPAYDTNAELT
jgi:agmatinase